MKDHIPVNLGNWFVVGLMSVSFSMVFIGGLKWVKRQQVPVIDNGAKGSLTLLNPAS